MTDKLVEEAPYHPGYEDAGFAPTKLKELTDEEIGWFAKAYTDLKGKLNIIAFARAILRKAQEK
jgi:hypothetical protein